MIKEKKKRSLAIGKRIPYYIRGVESDEGNGGSRTSAATASTNTPQAPQAPL